MSKDRARTTVSYAIWIMTTAIVAITVLATMTYIDAYVISMIGR